MTTTTESDVVLRPLRRRHQRRPVPDLRAPPGGGADLPQRALRLLGAVPPRRRREGARRTGRSSPAPAATSSTSSRPASTCPPGVILFEDPPLHTMHRGLMSRVFTPRRMAALEDQVRGVLRRLPRPARRLRAASTSSPSSASMLPDAGHRHAARHPRAGPGRGAQQDRRQPAHRAGRADGGARRRTSPAATMFADYIDWRAEHPSDDLMTQLLNAEFEDETGDDAHADPPGGAHLHRGARRRRQRDHRPAHRLAGQGARRAPRPAPRRSSRTAR